MKRLALLIWFAAVGSQLSPAAAQQTRALCPGDCDRSRTVTVDELVMSANIALGDTRLDCTGGFGRYTRVDVTHVAQAVSRALHGCTLVGNVQLRIGESRSADDENNLTVFTEDMFPCLGYSITSNLEIDGSSISLSLTGIRPPHGDFCLTAIGPAALSTPIDLSPGEYTLSIRNGGPVDLYRITVTDDSIDTDVIHASFSGPDHYTAPRQNFFAAICYRAQFSHESAAERIDELCPLFFAELDRVGEWINPGVSNPWCPDFRLQRGECRIYHYDGDPIILEGLLEESQHYDLPHGYTSDRGHRLYFWDLPTVQ